MKPNLDCVVTNPQPDPYHKDTTGATWSKFYIDLETGCFGISQEYNDGATWWNRRVFASFLEQRPDEESARNYLDSEGRVLVQQVLDGSNIEVVGNHKVGRLNDDAWAAWDHLLVDLNNLPENQYTLLSCASFLGHLSAEDLGITAQTTDADIEKLAEAYREDSRSFNIILADSMIEFLCSRRDRLLA